SPQAILLGKLLGSSPFAYFLTIATVPLTFYCVLLGVAGVGLAAWLLLYLQIATTTIFLGTLSMIQRLDPATGKTTAGTGPGWGILALIVVGQILASSGAFLLTPWSAAVVGLLTPAPALIGVFQGDPWQYSLYFFGSRIPFLIVTPVSQLILSYL